MEHEGHQAFFNQSVKGISSLRPHPKIEFTHDCIKMSFNLAMFQYQRLFLCQTASHNLGIVQ